MTTTMATDRKLHLAGRILPSEGRMLEVISHLDPRLGGMSAIVPRLSTELTKSHNFEVELCVFRGPEEQHLDFSSSAICHSTWPCSRVAWLRDTSLRDSFRQRLAQVNGVHIHGLWETSATVAARLARAAGKPYVVSAHGMLEPWALRNKALKKRIYSALLERPNLHAASCLHALTEAEAQDYREFGCKQPIAIIPNGVDAPESADAALFLDRFPGLVSKKLLLFLGRIHFKKGLDLLIPAWAAIAKKFPDAMLVLAGPDSENSLAPIQNLIEEYGIVDRVMYTGMLCDDLKWSALAAGTCFVLPSYSEGLSVAILEALSIGLPVIASEQCHIPEIAASGAGWIIQTEVHSLQLALKAVLENEPSANQMVGHRGKLLAKQYRWEVVAGKMAELYRWISGGPRPSHVVLDGVRP